MSTDHYEAWIGWPRRLPEAPGADAVELILALDGPLRLRIDGWRLSLPPGRMCAIWGGASRRGADASAPPRLGRAGAPLIGTGGAPLSPPLRRALLGGAVLIEPRLDAGDEPAITRWAGELASANAVRRRTAAAEIRARLQRFALNRPRWLSAAASRERNGDGTGGAVDRMGRYLVSNFRRAVRVDQVARDAGLNPNYASTLFREATGVTLIEQLTRYRVRCAQDLLATTNLDVAAVARRSGFGSVSRFYEAFAARCGHSPRRYRALVIGDEPVGGGRPSTRAR